MSAVRIPSVSTCNFKRGPEQIASNRPKSLVGAWKCHFATSTNFFGSPQLDLLWVQVHGHRPRSIGSSHRRRCTRHPRRCRDATHWRGHPCGGVLPHGGCNATHRRGNATHRGGDAAQGCGDAAWQLTKIANQLPAPKLKNSGLRESQCHPPALISFRNLTFVHEDANA